MFPLRDRNPNAVPTPVTWLLLVAIVVTYVAQVASLNMPSESAAQWMYRSAFVAEAFWQNPMGQAFSLVTHAFLHADLLHLIGNAFFLVVFGDNVEARLGSRTFLGFYLAAAVVAALLHGGLEPQGWRPMVGASGAISAVLGAYILWFPRKQVQTLVAPLFLPWLLLRLFLPIPRFFLWWLPAWLYIGYWALIQFWEAGGSLTMVDAGASVAWWAHVGGFVFGLVMAPILVRK